MIPPPADVVDDAGDDVAGHVKREVKEELANGSAGHEGVKEEDRDGRNGGDGDGAVPAD